MRRPVSIMAAGMFVAVTASGNAAAPQAFADCRALTDSAARLTCYDSLNGQALPIAPSTTQQTAPAVRNEATPPASGYPPPVPAPASKAARRSDFDSRISSVTPLRHGYYRLVLEDGSAYFTTSVAPPPAVGAEVHIRRTFAGTTYLDTKGRDPIAIRTARQQ